jgi:pimeloyl-ACP methyl ester carboxylesterase
VHPQLSGQQLRDDLQRGGGDVRDPGVHQRLRTGVLGRAELHVELRPARGLRNSAIILAMPDWLMRPRRRGKTKLANGRSLGWAEWGDERGRPVLLFSGAGMSASLGFGVEVLDRLELRLIAVDRPGLGLSDPAPHRTLLDWAQDVAALIHTRTLGPTPAVGFSQGGPFALACASTGVVRAVAIVSGTDELAAPEVRERLPEELRALVDRVASEPDAAEASFRQLNPEAMWRMILENSSAEDRRVYQQPGFARAYRRALDDGFARGSAGYARDTVLTMSRWPFELAHIAIPVELWYGARDTSPVHSPDFGESLARRIPNARRTIVPDAGGSLLWTHAATILTRLLAA